MSVSNRFRSFFSPHKPDIESTVRTAVNEVMKLKTKIRPVKDNGAVIHIGSPTAGVFLDPDVDDGLVVDENIEKAESDWLR